MAQVEKYNLTAAMGVIAHTERTCKEHSNLSIDPTRTESNYSLWPRDNPDQVSESRAFARLRQRLKEVSLLKRKDVNVLCSWCIHLGVDTLPGYDDKKQFFEACVKYICNLYGAENVMYAWVHQDEEHPHIHIGFVPVVKKPLKLRKNASEATKRAYEEALDAGKTHVDRVDAEALINLRHLQGWHPNFRKFMVKELGYDPGVHTGITEALGGNMTVSQLKKQSPDWRETRNAQAAAYHAVRRESQTGEKAGLDAKIAVADPDRPQPQSQATPGQEKKGRSLADIMKSAQERGGRSGF